MKGYFDSDSLLRSNKPLERGDDNFLALFMVDELEFEVKRHDILDRIILNIRLVIRK